MVVETSPAAADSVQGYTQLREYRYERKFLVEDLRPFQIEGLVKLHPRMFYSPYPPRWVNNLYLDTPDLENYQDNVNGAAHRRKVRARWYGDPFGEISQPVLEFKVKQGLVGTKYSYPLASFCLDDLFCERVFQVIARSSQLPERVWRELREMNIVLFNRYYRRYYASCDGCFRLTLDSEMTFYKINGAFGNNFLHRQVNFRELVVELKYDVNQESQASRVAGFFPFRVTRNSKYIQGMERVFF